MQAGGRRRACGDGEIARGAGRGEGAGGRAGRNGGWIGGGQKAVRATRQTRGVMTSRQRANRGATGVRRWGGGVYEVG